MKAILSCTTDDKYLFNLPFAIYSWRLIGVECIVVVPAVIKDERTARKFNLIIDTIDFRILTFGCEEEKEATYAQCGRLYAAAEYNGDDVLITSDADMCVFNQEYWQWFGKSNLVNIIGSDLVPDNQYPMCYVSMAAQGWRKVMAINNRTLQECLDELLGDIECENFRGNYWGKDQEMIFNQLRGYDILVVKHPRAQPGTQFATRRADRDGWPVNIPLDIIDAHLPRPGHWPENFGKIYQLFQTMYPNKDHLWMLEYYHKYTSL